MKINALVAEIGSTTTVVNGFNGIGGDDPVFLGQGQAPTSVLAGDVRIGLMRAIDDLKEKLGARTLEYDEMFATSSAAGGLRMSVHGLIFDMTVRAAKEAALGAGAIVHQVTAGKLRRTDLKALTCNTPNIILIAGGVDYGDRETAIHNAEKIAALDLDIPIIYAGNVENQEEMKLIFATKDFHAVDNVFPKIDELNVEPTRKVIQEVFEDNITRAPGMEHVYDMVTETIMPTPSAVMQATKLIAHYLGDVLVLDVGGATTDIHSVTKGSAELGKIQVHPEPVAKRTVEGDLGVYVNARNVARSIGRKRLEEEGFEPDVLAESYKHIPKTDEERRFVTRLSEEAVLQGIKRHVGKIRHIYGPTGRHTLVQGKDLTQVKYIIGTGGALTRLEAGAGILKRIITQHNPDQMLLPKANAQVLLDRHYIMASLGVLSTKYEAAALKLLQKSLGDDAILDRHANIKNLSQ